MKGNREDLLEAGRAIGPLMELGKQVKQGKLTADQLQLVVEGKNPFKNQLRQILIFNGSKFEEYENLLSFEDDEWACFFDCDFLLPIGSVISLLDKRDGKTICFEIIEYIYEEGILVFVKVSDESEEISQPKDVVEFLKNNWTCGSRNLKKFQ